MINAYCKQLKAFLLLKVKKIDYLVALIYMKFLDFLNLNKFLNILLTLLLLTTLLSSTLSAFGIKFDNVVVFNIKVNDAVILLKSWIKL